MLKGLHKSRKHDVKSWPIEGRRGLLCSNNKSFRSPSFGSPPPFAFEDDAIDYLAETLVEAFLERKTYVRKQVHNQTSGDLLPGVDA